MKIFSIKAVLTCSLFSLLAITANAGLVLDLNNACSLTSVTAGISNATSCLGLYDRDGNQTNASTELLNNVLAIDPGGWSADGAFGRNDWVAEGVHEFDNGVNNYDFLQAVAPLWTVDSAISGDYVIAVKQSNLLGLWYFEDLNSITSGTFDTTIFENVGWSNIRLFSSVSETVPEPGPLGLLALGLLGLAAARKNLSR